jgi:hypothetical protein
MITPPWNGKTKTVKGWDVGILRLEGLADVPGYIKVVEVTRIGYKAAGKGYAISERSQRMGQVLLRSDARWEVRQGARHGDITVAEITGFQPAVMFLALGGRYMSLHRFTQKDLAA